MKHAAQPESTGNAALDTLRAKANELESRIDHSNEIIGTLADDIAERVNRRNDAQHKLDEIRRTMDDLMAFRPTDNAEANSPLRASGDETWQRPTDNAIMAFSARRDAGMAAPNTVPVHIEHLRSLLTDAGYQRTHRGE